MNNQNNHTNAAELVNVWREKVSRNAKPASGPSLTNATQTTSDGLSSTEGAAQTTDVRHMVRLWERMSHIYPMTWCKAMGETATINAQLTPIAQTWLGAMQTERITPQQIADGIAALMREGSDFIPSLPKWLRLCKPQQEVIPLCHRPYISDQQRLALADGRTPEEKRQARIEKARPHLEAIRAALRKGDV